MIGLEREVDRSCANFPNIAAPRTTAAEGCGGMMIGMFRTVARRPIRGRFLAWDPDYQRPYGAGTRSVAESDRPE